MLIDNYPELLLFRDIVFLFKSMMVPSSDKLPELKCWGPQDAALEWKFKAASQKDLDGDVSYGKFAVKGFGKWLECSSYVKEEDPAATDGGGGGSNNGHLESKTGGGEKNSRGRGKSVAASVMGAASGLIAKGRRGMTRLVELVAGQKPRAPPSGANPSHLAGVRVVTEDDVLHLKTLPDFDGRLRARDSELLLQYLTAPYLRIPMILGFFSDQVRINALCDKELQGVLDATLFEPGEWQEMYEKEAPKVIPPPTRSHLHTPCGLLFNELQKSPRVTVEAVEKMLDLVLDLDTGKFTPSSSPLTMYIIRLVVRVESFVSFLVWHDDWKAQHTNQLGEQDTVTGTGYASWVRGLDCPEEHVTVLRGCHERLQHRLLDVFKVLDSWLNHALEDRKVNQACVILCHMAYLHRNLRVDTFTRESVATLLTAHVFININYRFDVECPVPGFKGLNVSESSSSSSGSQGGAGGGSKSGRRRARRGRRCQVSVRACERSRRRNGGRTDAVAWTSTPM